MPLGFDLSEQVEESTEKVLKDKKVPFIDLSINYAEKYDVKLADIHPTVNVIFSDLEINWTKFTKDQMKLYLGQVLDDIYSTNKDSFVACLEVENVWIIRSFIDTKYKLDDKEKEITKKKEKIKESNIKIKESNIKIKESNIKIKESNIKIKESNIKIKESNKEIVELFRNINLKYRKEKNKWKWDNFIVKHSYVYDNFDSQIRNGDFSKENIDLFLEYRFAAELMVADFRERGVARLDVSEEDVAFLETVNKMSVGMGLPVIDLNFGSLEVREKGEAEYSLEEVSEDLELSLKLGEVNDGVAKYAGDSTKDVLGKDEIGERLDLDEEIVGKLSVMLLPQVKWFIEETFKSAGYEKYYLDFFEQIDELKFDIDGNIELAMRADVEKPKWFEKVLADLSSVVKDKFLGEDVVAKFQGNVVSPVVNSVIKEKSVATALQGVTRYFDAFYWGLDLGVDSVLDLKDWVDFDPEKQVLEFQIHVDDPSFSGVKWKSLKFRYDLVTGEMFASDFFARKKTVNGRSRMKDGTEEQRFVIGGGGMEKLPIRLPKFDDIQAETKKSVLDNVPRVLWKLDISKNPENIPTLFKKSLSKNIPSVLKKFPEKDYNSVVLQHVMQKNLLAGFQHDLVKSFLWDGVNDTIGADKESIFDMYDIFDSCCDYFSVDELVKFKSLLSEFMELTHNPKIRKYTPGDEFGNEYCLAFARLFNGKKLKADRKFVKNNGQNSLSAFFESIDNDDREPGNVIKLDDLKDILENVKSWLYQNWVEGKNDRWSLRYSEFLMIAEEVSSTNEADDFLYQKLYMESTTSVVS